MVTHRSKQTGHVNPEHPGNKRELEAQMLADRIKNPTMYEDDRPPQVFEPLLDRIQREIEDLTTEERLALSHYLFGGDLLER